MGWVWWVRADANKKRTHYASNENTTGGKSLFINVEQIIANPLEPRNRTRSHKKKGKSAPGARTTAALFDGEFRRFDFDRHDLFIRPSLLIH